MMGGLGGLDDTCTVLPQSILGSDESCTNYGTTFKFQFQF
jgi:hypothetical protein